MKLRSRESSVSYTAYLDWKETALWVKSVRSSTPHPNTNVMSLILPQGTASSEGVGRTQEGGMAYKIPTSLLVPIADYASSPAPSVKHVLVQVASVKLDMRSLYHSYSWPRVSAVGTAQHRIPSCIDQSLYLETWSRVLPIKL